MDLLNRTRGLRIRSKPALTLALCLLLAVVQVACSGLRSGTYDAHRWWDGLGPVLPHDTFPADCTLCHTGDDWNTLRADFEFDHAANTGVPLHGAHSQAQCLRCHNDRGPVATFAAQGCAGCHEDVHYGQLGPNCTDCHIEQNWRPFGQIELHNDLGFPLIGVHAVTQCQACHPGAVVGRFQPTDNECFSCHADDFAGAVLQHQAYINGGIPVERCDRCHLPTNWAQAEADF